MSHRWYHNHRKSNYSVIRETPSVVSGGPFSEAGASGSWPESSLLSTLCADIVLEKRLHLCPPAHLGGFALKAAFLPRSFAFQHLSHPEWGQRYSQREVFEGKATEKPRAAALSLSSWAGGKGEEE